MHEIDPFLAFEPSKNTKSMWRYTRKSPSSFAGGVTLPGLFQTSNFELDAAGFSLVIALELWGLYNLLAVGNIAFAYVAGLFLADVLFAVCRHLPQGPICEANNRLLVTTDDVKRDKIRAQIARLKLIPHLFSLLIVLIASVKVVGFFGLQGGEADMLTVTILLSYALAAVLHITCTGYFLFAIATSLLMMLDRRRYRNSDVTGLDPYRGTFTSPAALVDVQVDRHHLFRTQSAQAAAEPEYTLETTGLLQDRQLHTFVSNQPQSGRGETARRCVERQLDLLAMEPLARIAQGV